MRDQNIDSLLKAGSAALKKAAMNVQAKQFLLENEPLFRVVKKAADRYIGGETLEEVTEKTKLQNAAGMKCSIEFMGENISSAEEASAATEEFIRICKVIHVQKLYSTVSLDLSHIGLGISKQLVLENLEKICEAAGPDTEVIISAEDVGKTDDVLETYTISSRKNDNLAITLQAYLYRTKDDFKSIQAYPGRIRVVKGAFDTPTGVSMPRGKELNDTYLGYVSELLSSAHKCAIATHDLHVQTEAAKLVDHYKSTHEIYEFESLFGIQTQQLVNLKNEGYMTKLYFVYGKEWYLYLCNRIAENPINLFLALEDMVG